MLTKAGYFSGIEIINIFHYGCFQSSCILDNFTPKEEQDDTENYINSFLTSTSKN